MHLSRGQFGRLQELPLQGGAADFGVLRVEKRSLPRPRIREAGGEQVPLRLVLFVLPEAGTRRGGETRGRPRKEDGVSQITSQPAFGLPTRRAADSLSPRNL